MRKQKSKSSSKSFDVTVGLINGGIGDFLYQVQALKYASMAYDYVDFRAVFRDYFHELGTHFLKGYVSKVYRQDHVFQKGQVTWVPRPHFPDYMGFHLAEVAFMYICNHPVPKGWWKLPEIKGDEAPMPAAIKGDYVVICAGGTTANRTMPPHVVEGLTNYVLDKGLVPVYLGKEEMSKEYRTMFPLVDYSKGVDLRDKTGLLEAAVILANAKLVVGLDGGLMHLASCSRVPTLWGMTVASWEKRKPHREAWSTYVSASHLDCIGCQEKWRYLYMHNFRDCLRKHLKCVLDLRPEQFIEKAEEVL